MDEIATRTLERKTGARGLRAELEKLLIPIMYDVSSRDDIKSVLIDAECVRNESPVKIELK